MYAQIHERKAQNLSRIGQQCQEDLQVQMKVEGKETIYKRAEKPVSSCELRGGQSRNNISQTT